MWAPWQRAHRGNASTKTPCGLETANLGNQKLINFTQVIGETTMKTIKTLKVELLVDPATHAEYVSVAREFEMARELIAARSRAGLTQGEVASAWTPPRA